MEKLFRKIILCRKKYCSTNKIPKKKYFSTNNYILKIINKFYIKKTIVKYSSPLVILQQLSIAPKCRSYS